MYLEFFGMRELPFTLTPNTDFFLDLDGHHRALEVIQLALESGEGFLAGGSQQRRPVLA